MNTLTATAIATPFATPLTTQLSGLRTALSSCSWCRLAQSFGQPVLVYRLQPLAQLPHCIALARQQRVDAHPRALGELAEREALELLRHEYLALLARQLGERRLDLLEQHAAHRR